MEDFKTKHGLDKIGLMIKLIKLIDGTEPSVDHYNLISYIEGELKRPLTANEKLLLAKGILKYIQSDEVTNERMDAIDYLQNAEFLD